MDEQKPQEVLTEVTSIAQEEQRTGEKIEVPGPEQLVERASHSWFQCTQMLAGLYPKLSSKEKTRVFLALLDLPTDNVPVKLKSDMEKKCYALGQKAQIDKFTILYDHVAKEQARMRLEAEQKKSQVTELTEEQAKAIEADLDKQEAEIKAKDAEYEAELNHKGCEDCHCAADNRECTELKTELSQEITNEIK